MRVLVVHNRYSSSVPSGENRAVDEEVEALRADGVEVVTIFADNDDVLGAGRLRTAMSAGSAVWSLRGEARARDAIAVHRPDVMHVHNVFPLVSASVLRAAERADVPIVWTAHNFRLSCIAGSHFRNGAACHACGPSLSPAGVRNACYAGGRASSAVLAVGSELFRRRLGAINSVVAISPAMERWLIEVLGVSPDRIRSKSNSVLDPGPAPPPSSSHEIVFVGRLAEEKGILLALDAWARRRQAGRLVIVGAGPLESVVRDRASTDASIVVRGNLGPGETAAAIAASRASLVLPLWEEPFGRVAAESFAAGRPVIAVGSGGVVDIVDESTGSLVAPHPDAVAGAIDRILEDDPIADRLGGAARRRWEERFSPEASVRALRSIYEELTPARR